MEISVTLKARYQGEIQRFLCSYFGTEQNISCEAMQITYIFFDSIDAHNIVNTFADNMDNYCADMWVNFEDKDFKVTEENLYTVLCAILARAA